MYRQILMRTGRTSYDLRPCSVRGCQRESDWRMLLDRASPSQSREWKQIRLTDSRGKMEVAGV
jgi:hypothetical protein